MAQLLGGADLLIGRARKAVVDESLQARARCSKPCRQSARNDAGYIFHKAQWLRREDKPIEAARLLLTGAAQRLAAAQSRRMVDRAPPRRAQAARPRTRTSPPTRSRAMRCRRRRKTCAPSTSSPPAGSRCASPTIRRPPTSISRASATAPRNPTTLARGEYWQGRAAEACRTQQRGARTLSSSRAASRPPITGRSPAPGSAWANLHCAVRRTSAIVRR